MESERHNRWLKGSGRGWCFLPGSLALYRSNGTVGACNLLRIVCYSAEGDQVKPYPNSNLYMREPIGFLKEKIRTCH